MRPSLLFLVALSLVGAQASWFGSDSPKYAQWSTADLQKWLKEHNIDVPSSFSREQLQELVKSNLNSASAWSQEQFTNAQKTFQDIRESSFNTWDESRLRNFLLEQGIVSPSGPREQLVLLAKQKYRAYQDAAGSFSSSLSSLSSQASASANTAIYGDSTQQASRSLSSIAAQATKEAVRTFDNAKDYVYSTWDNSQLESYLRERGFLKDKTEYSRQDLLAMMQNAYARTAEPVWQAWSNSYIHQWLVDHNVIKSDYETNRDALVNKMKFYYYDINNGVWSTWSDSDLKVWLVENNIVKDEAQISRDKLIKLVQDNYVNAADTIWGAWSDSDIRSWLVQNGHLKSDEETKRDELIKIMNSKYTDASARMASYLVWPDARLRAYLRERGISEDALPTSRPGLLQEVRIHWVQTTHNADALYARIRDIVNGGVEAAEDSINRILEILGARSDQASQKAKETYDSASEKASERLKQGGERVTGEL